MPPSQPFIHGCLRVKGRRGKHAIASNKTDHRFGVNAWSVQVNQTMCSIRTDHAISGRTVTFILEYFVCRNERSIFVIQL